MAKSCVIVNCGQPVFCRGLCRTCYRNAWRFIQSGQTNWTELEARGLSRPPRRYEKAIRSAFAAALDRSRKTEAA